MLESNRTKHLAVGFIIGFTFGYNAAIAAGAAAEFKDWTYSGYKGGKFGFMYGNGFDWLDLAATALGGLAGHITSSIIGLR